MLIIYREISYVKGVVALDLTIEEWKEKNCKKQERKNTIFWNLFRHAIRVIEFAKIS